MTRGHFGSVKGPNQKFSEISAEIRNFGITSTFKYQKCNEGKKTVTSLASHAAYAQMLGSCDLQF